MAAIEPPRGSSLSAAYSEADDKFTDWGALFGFRLNSNEMETNPGVYDTPEFRGITFFARADSGASTEVLVDVVDAQTWNKGGVCTRCDDHFTKIVTLTPCWTQYKVAFSELKQSGWGQAFAAVDLTKVWSIQFASERAAHTNSGSMTWRSTDRSGVERPGVRPHPLHALSRHRQVEPLQASQGVTVLKDYGLARRCYEEVMEKMIEQLSRPGSSRPPDRLG
ncbi:hypothetical protein [Sorangium sp. So ce542]|uniref:hypothetical protein n=1 Tax=Sorangium sp. So ce542 TaxID=3133316 RepID=UPI003F61147E